MIELEYHICVQVSTVRNADKIIVMERGQVADQGTHDELLERGGIYADLYRLQFQDGKTLLDPKGIAAQIPATMASEKTAPTGWVRRLITRLLG